MSLTIQYTNYSSGEWVLWDWNNTNIDWDASVNKSPSKTLMAHSGSTTAQAEQISSSGFTQGDMSIQVGYQCEGQYVGVLCRTSVQVFGIGKGDSWSYLKDGKWVEADQDTSPVTFSLGRFVATATPTLSHHDATISVLIKDAK